MDALEPGGGRPRPVGGGRPRRQPRRPRRPPARSGRPPPVGAPCSRSSTPASPRPTSGRRRGGSGCGPGTSRRRRAWRRGFPTARPSTSPLLSRVERAEAAVRALGFRELRVRHGGDTARIEVPVADLDRLIAAAGGGRGRGAGRRVPAGDPRPRGPPLGQPQRRPLGGRLGTRGGRVGDRGPGREGDVIDALALDDPAAVTQPVEARTDDVDPAGEGGVVGDRSAAAARRRRRRRPGGGSPRPRAWAGTAPRGRRTSSGTRPLRRPRRPGSSRSRLTRWRCPPRP